MNMTLSYGMTLQIKKNLNLSSYACINMTLKSEKSLDIGVPATQTDSLYIATQSAESVRPAHICSLATRNNIMICNTCSSRHSIIQSCADSR